MDQLPEFWRAWPANPELAGEPGLPSLLYLFLLETAITHHLLLLLSLQVVGIEGGGRGLCRQLFIDNRKTQEVCRDR